MYRVHARFPVARTMAGIVFITLLASLNAACDGSGSNNSVSNVETEPMEEVEVESVFTEHGCEIAIPQGFTAQDVRCGTLTAPLNRDEPGGDTVNIEFGVILARQSGVNEDPFVYVPGGPGDESLSTFFAFDALDLLKSVNETRDLVYFDPRGTGISTPSLACPERREQANAAYFTPGGAQEDQLARLEGMQLCLERVMDAGTVISGYHSAAIAADLSEGLRALGYTQVNLWGTSYGGRIAQTLMRDFPELVRSAILDASTMSDIRETDAANFQLSINRVFAQCADSESCAANYPDLENQFYSVIEQLNAEPAEAAITFEGAERIVYVSGDRFLGGIANALNANSLLPLIPIAIANTAAGDYTLLRAIAPDLLSAFDSIAWGHYASVVCAEVAPYWSEAERQASNASVNPLISAALDPISHGVDVDQCEFWQVDPRPAIAGESILSDIPSLILQGEYDVSVPQSYSERASENLANSQYVLFPGFGHVVLPQAFDAEGSSCAQQLLAEFLATPNSLVDTSCLEELTQPF
ncbi:MAG: alpha/beta fold hydrolase [Pseudomonadota bacterium]